MSQVRQERQQAHASASHGRPADPARMRHRRAHLASVVLTLVLAVAAQSLAHGPSVEISDAQAVRTEEGVFLDVRVDPPDGGTVLTAVATPFGVGELEANGHAGFLPTEGIPLTHERSSLGPEGRFRVRLPEGRPGETSVPVTFLFSGGSVVRTEIDWPTSRRSAGSWMRSGAAARVGAGVVGGPLLALLAWAAGRRKRSPTLGSGR